MRDEIREKNLVIKSLLDRKQHEIITDIPENNNNVEICESETINVTRDLELDNVEEIIHLVIKDDCINDVDEDDDDQFTDISSEHVTHSIEHQLDLQLNVAREEKQKEYSILKKNKAAINGMSLKPKIVIDRGITIPVSNCIAEQNTENDGQSHEVKLWPVNTTLIAGDSIISNVCERRLSRKNSYVKRRVFPGATVRDMYHCLLPLLEKKPSNIIYHVGTNDTSSKPPEEILAELLKLKHWILSKLPSCNVIISHPTIRNDHYIPRGKIYKLRSLLRELNCTCIPHSNIDNTCLGRGKLHLNHKGVSQLENNFKSYIWRL